MAANPEGPPEIAMTHVVGADGMRRFCPRPVEVRQHVDRLQAWRDEKETCCNCLSAFAVRIVSGAALCVRCRDQRAERMGSVALLNRRVDQMRAATVTGDGFEGHAIVFDALSLDLGGFRERILPSAINRTLTEGLDILALWNHNSDRPLGRMSANTLSVRKDDIGLYMKTVPPNFDSGYYIESVERRDVKGQSFGFRALEDEWFLDGQTPIREVIDMRVSEVSVVVFPAYPSTDVSVVRDMTIRRTLSLDMAKRIHKSRMAR